MRKAVLLRVGIDSGSGGMQGPLFTDGSFEFICIPDYDGVSKHTYGNCIGRNGIPHSDYFPLSKRSQMVNQHVHNDPEFETLTYGDPTTPKRSLRTLEKGDYLIFYCGLQNWDKTMGCKQDHSPALYIIGYFEVEVAGMAKEFTKETLKAEFGNNFHVRYPSIFKRQQDRLVLVKGGPRSRLLVKACKISVVGQDRAGKPLKILSPAMQNIFGDFNGHISIQRSPPRWVEPTYVEKAIKYVKGLM